MVNIRKMEDSAQERRRVIQEFLRENGAIIPRDLRQLQTVSQLQLRLAETRIALKHTSDQEERFILKQRLDLLQAKLKLTENGDKKVMGDDGKTVSLETQFLLMRTIDLAQPRDPRTEEKYTRESAEWLLCNVASDKMIENMRARLTCNPQ